MAFKRYLILITIVIIMLFLLLLLNCDLRPVDRNELPGKYIANHNEGVDSLILNGDGSYRLYFHPRGTAKCLSDSGKWYFDKSKYNRSIVLLNISISYISSISDHQPCHTLLGGHGNRNVSLSVIGNKFSNQIKIAINSDCDYYYIKQ